MKNPDTKNEKGISRPLARNIGALMRRRRRQVESEKISERVAALIAAFTGSIWSVIAHAVLFAGWIAANLNIIPGIPPWDPTLVVLAMAASVEAIFLTTFVLMNQNRIAAMEDERAELTLQISLLAEHEMTQLAHLVAAMARRLGVPALTDKEISELTQEVAPENVLDEIERKRGD